MRIFRISQFIKANRLQQGNELWRNDSNSNLEGKGSEYFTKFHLANKKDTTFVNVSVEPRSVY